MIHPPTRLAIAAAGIICVIGLSACGGVSEEAAQNVAEQAVEEAMGGEVDIEGDSMTMTDAEGNQMAVGEDVALPDTWPAEIPVAAGSLAMASVGADGTIIGSWLTDGTPEEAAAAYGSLLEAAGYEISSDSSFDGSILREYTSATLYVSVMASATDGQTSLTVSAFPS